MANPQITASNLKKSNLFRDNGSASVSMPKSIASDKALFENKNVKGTYTGAFSGLETEVKTGSGKTTGSSPTTGSVWGGGTTSGTDTDISIYAMNDAKHLTRVATSNWQDSIWQADVVSRKAASGQPTAETTPTVSSEAAAAAKTYISNAQSLAGEATSLMEQAAAYENSGNYSAAKTYYEKAQAKLAEARETLSNAYENGDQATLLQVSLNISTMNKGCEEKIASMSGMMASPYSGDGSGSSGSSTGSGFWGNLGKQLADSLGKGIGNGVSSRVTGSGNGSSSSTATSSGSGTQRPGVTGTGTGAGSGSGVSSISSSTRSTLGIDAKYLADPEVRAADADYAAAATKIAAARTVKTQQNAIISAAKAEIKELEKEIDELSENGAPGSEELANQYMTAKQEEAELLKTAASKRAIFTQNTELVNSYEAQLQQKNTAKQQIDRDVTNKKTVFDNASTDVKNKENTINNTLKPAVTSTKEAFEAAERAYNTCTDESKKSDLKTTMDQKRADWLKAENDLKNANLELERLKTVEAQKKQEYEAALKRQEAAQKEIDTITEARDKIKNQLQTQENEAKQAEAAAQRKSVEVEQLEAQMKEIQSKDKNGKVCTLTDKIDAAYKKITDAEAIIAQQDAIISAEENKQATAKDRAEIGIRRLGGWWHALTL